MTSAPTATYRQHVEEIEAPRVDGRAFRQGWRVRTRLDALLADGRINAGVWQAAVEYRDAWARVWAGRAGELAAVRVSGGADVHGRLISRMGTLTALLAVERAIGPEATALCTACVVLDRSWASTARLCRCNPETVRDWTVLALRTLAWAWAGGRGDGLDLSDMRPAPRCRVRAS